MKYYRLSKIVDALDKAGARKCSDYFVVYYKDDFTKPDCTLPKNTDRFPNKRRRVVTFEDKNIRPSEELWLEELEPNSDILKMIPCYVGEYEIKRLLKIDSLDEFIVKKGFK